MGKMRAFKSAALVEANFELLEVGRTLIAVEKKWDFFCECGNWRCRERVTLTVNAYSALHDRGAAVLAAGHRVSQVERARQLQEDSRALRAQAELQVKQAQKNLRDSQNRSVNGG